MYVRDHAMPRCMNKARECKSINARSRVVYPCPPSNMPFAVRNEETIKHLVLAIQHYEMTPDQAREALKNRMGEAPSPFLPAFACLHR